MRDLLQILVAFLLILALMGCAEDAQDPPGDVDAAADLAPETDADAQEADAGEVQDADPVEPDAEVPADDAEAPETDAEPEDDADVPKPDAT
jgi:hypothetical protein